MGEPAAFSPAPGINSDDTTFAAEGRWADGSNVRFVRGKPQVIGGWTRQGSYTLSGACTDIAWLNNGSTIAYGTTTKLYVLAAGTLYDITPAGFTSCVRWSLQAWGDYLLAVPQGGTLYVWDGNTANDATEVTQAPDEITSMLVTPERQVLALGCNEETSGTFNSRCIRGCDIEDYTDWTTSATNNAFEYILEATAPISIGKMLGDYVGVWTQSTFHLGTFIGDPSQTYRFQRIGKHGETTSPRSVVVKNSTAWWVTTDGFFRTYTVGGEIDEIPCPIFEDWIDHQTGGSAAIHGAYMPKYDEVWWFYNDDRDASSMASRYVAFCRKESALAQSPVWFRGQMKRAAMNTEFGVLAIDENGYAQGHETGTTANGAALNWFIQSADQYIDQGKRRMMIRGITPDLEDQVGDVSLTLYTKQYPQSAAVTKGPYTLTTATVKKDFRVSGKLISVKLSGGDASGSYMRLGKPVFDVVPMGGR
jgi:hypothetical protein